MSIKTAMVLAAGRGTRMRSSANAPPKPLTMLGEQTLLDFVLARLMAAGVEHIIINLHHKAEQIKAHIAAQNLAAHIVFSDEQDLLRETGGGVKHALPLLGDAPFLVCNADIMWLEDAPVLPRLIDAFDASRMDALLLLARRAGVVGYQGAGDFMLGLDGRVQRYDKASSKSGDKSGDKSEDKILNRPEVYVFSGVQILRPDVFATIGDDVFSLNRVYDAAIARARLYGQCLEGRLLHVGTPEAHRQAELFLTR